jgi:hypothetical protein
MPVRVIHESEREDYLFSIASLGYSASDFELTEYPDSRSTEGNAFIQGTVEISRKSNNRRETYSAGHGSSWPAEFHDDLRQGKFGRA